MSSPGLASTPEPSSKQSSDTRELAKWQRKLLPYMTRFLAILAIGFFGLSMYDVYEMRSFVKSETSERVSSRVEELVHSKNGLQVPAGTTTDLVQQSLL
jgi:hypothetical protein